MYSSALLAIDLSVGVAVCKVCPDGAEVGGNDSCLRKMASAKKSGSGVLEKAANRRRSSKHKEVPIGIFSFNRHNRFLGGSCRL